MVGENGRNPVKNPLRPRFDHHETHMEGPRRELGTPAVGGERLTAMRHEAAFIEINHSQIRTLEYWTLNAKKYLRCARTFYYCCLRLKL